MSMIVRNCGLKKLTSAVVVWDNTCTLHRSVPGSYAGKYKRDLRRTTVHDMSSQAWGLNGEGATWRSGLD